MSIDNYTDIDVLFCQPFVDVVKSVVMNKGSESLTIGIFGLKISFKPMFLKLLKKDIPKISEKVIYIEVNAWMLEDYENAKVALMKPIIKDLAVCLYIALRIGKPTLKLIVGICFSRECGKRTPLNSCLYICGRGISSKLNRTARSVDFSLCY